MVTALPASGAGGAASLYAFPRVEGNAALAAAARSQHASLLTRRDVLGGLSVAPLTRGAKQVTPCNANPPSRVTPGMQLPGVLHWASAGVQVAHCAQLHPSCTRALQLQMRCMVDSADGSATADMLPERFTHQNHHQRHVMLFDVPQLRYTCAATGADCTAVRYRCTRRADVDLCPAAFAEGRFPAGTCARDFVRIDAADQPQVPLLKY